MIVMMMQCRGDQDQGLERYHPLWEIMSQLGVRGTDIQMQEYTLYVAYETQLTTFFFIIFLYLF